MEQMTLINAEWRPVF